MDKNAIIFGLVLFVLSVAIAVGITNTGYFIDNNKVDTPVGPMNKFVMQVCTNNAAKAYKTEANSCLTQNCLELAVLEFQRDIDNCAYNYALESTLGWDADTIIDAWDSATIIDCVESPY